jgi:hypothetical protein
VSAVFSRIPADQRAPVVPNQVVQSSRPGRRDQGQALLVVWRTNCCGGGEVIPGPALPGRPRLRPAGQIEVVLPGRCCWCISMPASLPAHWLDSRHVRVEVGALARPNRLSPLRTASRSMVMPLTKNSRREVVLRRKQEPAASRPGSWPWSRWCSPSASARSTVMRWLLVALNSLRRTQARPPGRCVPAGCPHVAKVTGPGGGALGPGEVVRTPASAASAGPDARPLSACTIFRRDTGRSLLGCC